MIIIFIIIQVVQSITCADWIPLGEEPNQVEYRAFKLYDTNWPRNLSDYIAVAADFGGINSI